MIAVIDYGAGNLRSVVKALTKLGQEAIVTSDPKIAEGSRALLLPGVGAAADAMKELERKGMLPLLRRWVAEGRPFFGVCLGLQLLLTHSDEGGCPCLGILPGTVRRLPTTVKVPHMGWNQVRPKLHHPLFEGIPDPAYFYFVHSYYPQVEDGSLVVGETEYGVVFPSLLIRGNLVATQFHPEKSGEIGLRLYQNFLRYTRS